MDSASKVPRVGTTETDRQDRRPTDTSVGDVLTEIAKRVLWKENTAPSLADAIAKSQGRPCSIRTAERYLGGECDWSGDAVAAIMAEILKRRGMRNVRVVARR